MRFFVCILVVCCLSACGAEGGFAYAQKITSPALLIGGPKALGALGDYLLANENIRVIIQRGGWSRGFGLFGGGILDADLVRPGFLGEGRGNGYDNFGEFFPALFFRDQP